MDPFENALNFLKSIKENLSDEQSFYLDRLYEPQNIVSADIEVDMDDGSKKTYKAYRSQHNNALGPYKGGIRFHEGVTESEVKALSLWMSLKTSIAGIPLGGGKGGVTVNPKELSEGEIERLSRAYMRSIADHIGVNVDVPAPDVNTTPEIMAIMLDEYEKHVKHHEPGVITGKPVEIGGSLGRTKATGYGGYLAMQNLRKALKEKYPDNKEAWYHKERKDVKIAIQGFGNVGYYFALSAYEQGYTVVAVSDSQGGIYDEAGLDPVDVLSTKKESGSVVNYKGKVITNEELLELEVDVLVPSALENVISKDNADKIHAFMVLELANGPVTPEGDEILSKKDCLIVPDIYANSGGVTVSYLEWVQNREGYYSEEHEVDAKLEKLMADAFAHMWDQWNKLAEKEHITMRQAAYIVAVERILKAEALKRPHYTKS